MPAFPSKKFSLRRPQQRRAHSAGDGEPNGNPNLLPPKPVDGLPSAHSSAQDFFEDAVEDIPEADEEQERGSRGEELPARPFNLEETIPPTNEHRTLVLCFDGTGDQFDDDNSNVVNFFTLLKKDNPDRQLVYYQAGIGTYSVPQVAKPYMARLRRTVDAMIGAHLNAHVMGGYEFLMQNYHEGDRICIFGFSRGAYTARCLAGMLHKVGLLPRGNHQQVPFAYSMYSKRNEKSWQQSAAFKQAFSIDVDIELLGVWDTVGSVGVIPRRLPFTTSNTHVRYFRHAIALDEHRVRFMPNFWRRATEKESGRGIGRAAMPRSGAAAHKARGRTASGVSRVSGNTAQSSQDADLVGGGAYGNGAPGHGPQVDDVDHSQTQTPNGQRKGSADKAHKQKTLDEMEEEYDVHGDLETNVEEVWFAGAHTDVGGGSVKNGTRNSLARIPLRWMVRQCFLLRTGILFHRDLLYSVGLDPDTLYPHVLHRPPALHASKAAEIMARKEAEKNKSKWTGDRKKHRRTASMGPSASPTREKSEGANGFTDSPTVQSPVSSPVASKFTQPPAPVTNNGSTPDPDAIQFASNVKSELQKETDGKKHSRSLSLSEPKRANRSAGTRRASVRRALTLSSLSRTSSTPSSRIPFRKQRPKKLQDCNLDPAICRGKDHHHTKLIMPVRGDFVSEEEEDLMDSLMPCYDQLAISKIWWVLEVFPQKIQKWQRDDGSWVRQHGMNFGRPRLIPKQEEHGVRVHRSVQSRMEAEAGIVMPDKPEKVYMPKARWTIDYPTWVA